MKTAAVSVLYEDNHLLVVNKPTGMATMGHEGADVVTLHHWGCGYLRRKYNKPGRVYLGIVHRLDLATSGVIVLAKTSKAAGRLSEQFRRTATSRQTSGDNVAKHLGPIKRYLAVVHGRLAQPQGRWSDLVVKDRRLRRMRVIDGAGPQPQGSGERPAWAELDYRVLGEFAGLGRQTLSLVDVQLLTGRKHQIRVQFASRGHAVDRDRKYLAATVPSARQQPPVDAISLHAWRLQIEHPTRRTCLTFEAPPPVGWQRLYRQLPLDRIEADAGGRT